MKQARYWLAGALVALGLAAAVNAQTVSQVVNSIIATSCTNQFVRSIAATGAGTCAAIAAGDFPALTGDVTTAGGSLATTLAAGSASNLNSGTLAAARGGTGVSNSANLTVSSATSVGRGQYQGTGTNDAATAGNVGEYLSGTLASGSATSITNNSAKTITSVSLTAGNWYLCGGAAYIPAGTTNITELVTSISGTDNVLDQSAPDVFTDTRFGASGIVPAGTVTQLAGGCTTKSISGTTTYYLVGYSTFTVSTMTMWGKIWAHRIR